MRRTLLAILLMTAGAAAVLRAQANAMAELASAQHLRAARAAAMEIAAGEISRAGASVRTGRPASGERLVETAQGRMRVETETRPQADRWHLLRVSVKDEGGMVLSTYETVVETEVP